MPINGLVARSGKEAAYDADVRALQDACAKADGFRVKFTGQVEDFCYYENGRLVGYAPLEGFGDSYEVTAAVHPDFRGRGIFRELFAAVHTAAERLAARHLLLVAYRRSSAEAARPTRCGAPYAVSEFRMEARIITDPAPVLTELILTEVTVANVAELSQLLAIAFGAERSRKSEQLAAEIEDSNVRYYLAELGCVAIGQIGVVISENDVYIRGFGIIPEYRRRGCGRQLLASVVHQLHSQGYRHFSLDVETQNANTLNLYGSCGFHEAAIYDYYAVM